MSALRFYWNGIKDRSGKLQRAFFSGGEYRNQPAGTICVYARDHSAFSREVRNAFIVRNESDSQTDYFETDRFYVTPDHPLYSAVKLATEAKEARNKAWIAKRNAARS